MSIKVKPEIKVEHYSLNFGNFTSGEDIHALGEGNRISKYNHDISFNNIKNINEGDFKKMSKILSGKNLDPFELINRFADLPVVKFEEIIRYIFKLQVEEREKEERLYKINKKISPEKSKKLKVKQK